MLKSKRNVRLSRRNRSVTPESLEGRIVLSTFYVSGDTGDDNNTGGQADPFSSLQRAVDAASSNPGGDTIEVEAAAIPYQGAFITDDSGALTIAGDGAAVSDGVLRASLYHDLTVTGMNFTFQAVAARAVGEAAPDLMVRNVTAGGWNSIDASTAGSITVTDSTFNAPSWFEPNTGAVRAFEFSSLVVDNVMSTGNVAAGVLTRRGGTISVSNSDFTHGVELSDSGDISLTNITVMATRPVFSTGHQIENFTSLSIDRVDSGSALTALSEPGSTAPVSIVDSSFNTGIWVQTAIDVGRVGDVVLRGVVTSGSNFQGAAISDARSVIITGHVAADNERVGIAARRVSGDVTISDVDVLNNSNGGIRVEEVGGDVTISDFEILNNVGDGIRIDDIAGATTLMSGESGGNSGNGFYVTDSGDTTVDGSTEFIGNADNGIAAIGVGAVDIGGTTILDSGPFEDGGRRNGLYIFRADSASVSDSVISDNSFDGLGIYGIRGDVDVSDVIAEGNAVTGFRSWSLAPVSISGGSFSSNTNRGIQLENSTSVMISDVTVADNGTTSGQYFGQTGAAGIGIATQAEAPISISRTAVYGNVIPSDGGGLWLQSNGAIEVTNSTIAENESTFSGGGLVSFSPIATTLTNLTIANNTAALEGGGLVSAGNVDIGNTIVSGNTSSFGNDIVGSVKSLGNNLISDPSGSSGFGSSDLFNVDPLLQPLADNGGQTVTMALAENSPALNAGNDAIAPATDQRGFARPQGGQSDIGAFETQVIQADILVGTSKLNLNNAIDNRGKFKNGTITVSILTNSMFDATTVDVSTVIWAGAAASSHSLTDADGDGDVDLQLEFRLRDTDLLERFREVADPDGSRNKQQHDLAIPLMAETFDGTSVVGEGTLSVFMTGKKLRDLLDGLF